MVVIFIFLFTLLKFFGKIQNETKILTFKFNFKCKLRSYDNQFVIIDKNVIMQDLWCNRFSSNVLPSSRYSIFSTAFQVRCKICIFIILLFILCNILWFKFELNGKKKGIFRKRREYETSLLHFKFPFEKIYHLLYLCKSKKK